MKRHPTPNNNLAPPQKNNPLTPVDLDNPEKLIFAAQKHFANAFPNERRVECPPPDVILSARADRPPGDELLEHLFRCSECFNEYSAAMRDHYRQTAAEAEADRRTKLMRALLKWRLPLLAGAAASLLLAASLFIQQRRQTESPQSVQVRSQPAPVASAENPLTPAPPASNAGQPPDPTQEKPRPAELLAINLNLNRNRALGDITRGGSRREEEKKIKLPPLRALLKLRLRRGSEAGLYKISVVDPNSNRLTGARARSRNGKSLDAVLDLRRAARTAHRLRVERGDDLNEYLIEITKR
jgi:DNA-directed RNA polymerase subunit M/transcription elongation factor TFIIS